MSTLVAAALLVSILFFAFPQTGVTSDTPVTIAVAKASWEKQTYRPGWDQAQDPASGITRDNTSASPPDTVLNANGTTGPPPSTVRGPERREPRNNRPDPRTTESSNGVTSPSERVNTYFYRIKVLNNGSKAIAAVDWEYQFATDDIEPSRHRFQSFQRIKAGSSSTLTGESRVPPSRVINASSKSKVNTRVVIYCVLYSDGSATWRPDRSEADCQSIRSRRESR